MEGLLLPMTIHPLCGKFGLSTVSLQVQDLLNYTTIDPMVQRRLSAMQRRKIANYLQERELEHVFFGPVTLSLREIGQVVRNGQNLVLRHGSKLSVLDGQHRLLALAYVNEQLLKEVRSAERKLASLTVRCRRNPGDTEAAEELERISGILQQLESRRLALMETELSVQLYIGLGEEEEKQLFGDINSKIMLVSKELGHSFDSTDPLNLIIQQAADYNVLLKSAGVETRSNLTSFNKNFTCNSWMYSTATMLFSGKMLPSNELNRKLRHDPPLYVEILHQFYSTLLALMPEQPGLAPYTSSSRVMQEGIALYAHSFLFAGGSYNPDWTDCLSIFEDFDWSHQNELLLERFGMLDNGKLNLIHEKSLKKHTKLGDLFRRLYAEKAGIQVVDESSTA